MVFSLEAYFERIGYEGEVTPTLAVLRQLIRLHTQRIPFENIDVLLKRPIQLAPEAIFRKLVLQHRGGYCFEQNGLFQQVLRRIGYEVHPLGARVRLSQPDRAHFPARTHLLSSVKVEGRWWIVDVGFGALSLTAPLLWEAGVPQHQFREPRRLVREGKRWFHQSWKHGQWQDIYEFMNKPMYLADQRMANWYTSTHPDSHFTQRLSMALALPNDGRVTVNGLSLRLLRSGQKEERFRIGREALGPVLAQHFGVHLNEEECAHLWRTHQG